MTVIDLPAPDSPTQPERFAALERERHVAQHRPGDALDRELDAEIVDRRRAPWSTVAQRCWRSLSRSPEQVEGDHHDDDRDAGGQRLSRIALEDPRLALGDHHAPVGLRRLDAEAEERDRREVEHRPAEQDRRLRDHELREVAQQMTDADRPDREPLDLERGRCRAGPAA